MHRPPKLKTSLTRRLAGILGCLQFELHVSAGGVGLYTADPKGAPQVFYLGHVAAPSSFFIPEDKVRRARACSP